MNDDTYDNHTCHDNCPRIACVLNRELTAMTEQRDRLAEAIITHRAKAFPLTGEDFDQELWQALQSLTPTQPEPK